MSPVTLAFASGLGDLAGVKALPFATAGLRLKLLGGFQGVSALGRILRGRGARVLPGVVGTAWASRSASEKDAVVERIVTLLEG